MIIVFAFAALQRDAVAVAAPADLAITYVSQVSGSGVPPGPTSASTWRVMNLGPGSASSIEVSFDVDKGSGPSPVGLEVRGCSYGAERPVSQCFFAGPLAPNASFDVTVEYYDSLFGGQTDVVPTTAHVALVDGGDPNSTNDAATADIVNTWPIPTGGEPKAPKVPPAQQQKVQFDTVTTVSSPTVVVGDTVAVRYTVTNDGTIGAVQYFLSPRIDGSATFLSVVASQGRCTDFMCDLDLAPGRTATVDAVLLVTAPGQILLHVGWVAGQGAAPLWQYVFASGGDATLTAIGRSSDLGVRASPSALDVRIGRPFRVTLTLTNYGPQSTPTGKVAIVSNGVAFESMHGRSFVCHSVPRMCQFKDLVTGSSARLVLTLIARAAGRGSITATASSGVAADAVPADNVAAVDIKVAEPRRRPR